jgi:hypothetical protein
MGHIQSKVVDISKRERKVEEFSIYGFLCFSLALGDVLDNVLKWGKNIFLL